MRPVCDAKIFTQQIVIQVSLNQSISATVSRRVHVKVNHVGHKGTTKMLVQIKVRRNWKAWRRARGWILRAHRGPHGVKHKGPISCSQHKQNGHRSSSVALTYRFSHFTDFPTLRIIIRPRALSFTGINRSEHHVCMNLSSFEFTWWTCDFTLFPAALVNKIFISFIDMYISGAAGASSFMGCVLRRAVGLWYAADWDNN